MWSNFALSEICRSPDPFFLPWCSGIGIVNAIEVLNAFPEEDGLQKFREWVESPDPSILGGLDAQASSSTRKRGSEVGDPDMSCSSSNVEGNSASDENVKSEDRVQKLKQIFMNKHVKHCVLLLQIYCLFDWKSMILLFLYIGTVFTEKY